MQTWKSDIAAELSRAQAARSRGNEAQARVCARRAAGIAIREYLERQDRPIRSASVMDLFAVLERDPALSPEAREIVSHLTRRVDENFKLPIEADLIADAQRLCRALLPDWDSR